MRAWAEGGESDDAERVLEPTTALAKGRDVFVFFDNDAKVCAPFDALSLADRLHGGDRRTERDTPEGVSASIVRCRS